MRYTAVTCMLLAAALLPSGPSRLAAGSGDLIFSDGFETGDLSRWSVVVGAGTCIASGTDQDIQSALVEEGSVAVLCPGSTFLLSSTVSFTADGQEIHTQGLPTDDSRALLRVVHSDVTTAVAATDRSGVKLRHVIVDGARPELGIGFGGLLEFGGAADGQVVEGVRAYEPRGWSVLVVNEGAGLACTGALVRNNYFGPAGRAEYIIADGISLACRSSIVTDNTIVDATDGGIVVFQAPGSLVARNQIRADDRIMFYGISMVDEGPFDNDFSGTQVMDNVIEARGALIRHGIDMGPWVGCFPSAGATRNRGATVQGNVLRGEHMGYGLVVAGVEDWTVTGNFDESTHVAPRWQRQCFGQDVDPPAGFQIDPDLSAGTFQPEFQDAVLDFGLNLWPLQPIVAEGCVADLIGASLLEQIKDGLLGPIWPAIEAAEGGELIDPCITEYADPPPVPAGAEDVLVAMEPCAPHCVTLRLSNVGEQAASLENAVFLLQDFVTTCEGMPASIPADDQATCVVDDFVADGIQVLSWYGFSPGPENSIVFEYPFVP